MKRKQKSIGTAVATAAGVGATAAGLASTAATKMARADRIASGLSGLT